MKNSNHGGKRAGAGRPKGSTGSYKNKIKEVRLTIRLSDEEKEILENCTKILKINRTKVVIKGLLELYEKIKGKEE